ncbi:hypothetical protein SAMN05444266_105304 [Chitinophaga jiangningensis]|uniref:YD repeat-containing protein n=1 Tax=Chitinophaga jiangningensis TaxID=1419482 RepID=A0A1M7E6E0_9BACT|nr:hypothetical protein [Chitinophaga jiangningensis]SHL87325.1 hypothetical protein SAMN05444266_105304 [Chitinophaga jiangningensis]
MKFRILLAAALLCQMSSFGQMTDLVNTTNIVPPTPEVSSLAKFIEMPTGTSSGIPNIGIPLYELKNGSISVPVSLNYNAGGIRVEENASRVGMGWDISAGGSVVRVVHGLPDDITPDGYMNTAHTIKYIHTLNRNSPEHWDIMYTGILTKTQDVEPDVFMYNLPGYTGKFYWSQDEKKFIEGKRSGLIIEYNLDPAGHIIGFIITTPNGNKYYLGISKDGSRQARDQYNNQDGSVETNGVPSLSDDPKPLAWHYTGWHLMEIVTPENKTVGFSYTAYNSMNYGRGGTSRDYKVFAGCESASNKISTSYFAQYSLQQSLTSIYSDLVTVRFVDNPNNREDVSGGKKLDSVVVTSADGKIIKNYYLQNDYVTTTDTQTPSVPGVSGITTLARKRLFLYGLWDLSNIGEPQAPYRFTYYKANELPHKLSTGQDLWGFYNGKTTNTNLLPPYLPLGVTGADRTVNLDRTMCGTLTKIEYPTGGTTEYTYESNIINSQNMNIVGNGFVISGLIEKTYVFYRAEQFRNPAGSNTFEDTFTIPYSLGTGGVKLYGCDNFNTISCPLKITIQGISDPTFFVWYKASSTTPLPAGTYKIRCEVDVDAPNTDFNVQITWQQLQDIAPDVEKRLIAGGLRIKKIVESDRFGGTLTRSYTYNRFEDSNISSGLMKNLPVTAYWVFCGEGGSDNDPLSTGNEGQASILRISSHSGLPGYSNSSTGIIYEHVTEYQDEQAQKMKTEYEFSNDWTNFVQPSDLNYPAKTGMAADWRTGLLLTKRVYENVAEPLKYRILSKEVNSYSSYEMNTDLVGIRISPWINHNTYGTTYYNGATEWYELRSATSSTYSYDANGNASEFKITKDFTYDPGNNYFQKTLSTTDSKGQSVINTTWYPKDYNDISSSNIGTLLTKGIRNTPIKFESTVGGNLVAGQVLQYNANGQPAAFYVYENNQAIPPPAHDPNSLVPAGYNLKKVLAYEPQKGNIITSQDVPNVIYSYVWDYKNNLPIAQAINADNNSIAYTSFESEGSGNWTISGTISGDVPSVTGKRYFNLSGGSLNKSSLRPDQTYIISYWTKNANALNITGSISSIKGRNYKDWNYFEHKVTGVSNVSITGSGIIDEIRLFPADAVLTTYTYEPGIGVTSSSDQRGVIRYFEYDNWNRVSVIRDQDGNIIKAAEYKYQAPVTP